MNLSNYDRVYELTVGLPPQYIIPETDRTDPIDLTANTLVDDPDLDFRATEVLRAVKIKDGQIKAQVMGTTKSKGSDSVSAKITVLNKNEKTVETICKKNNFVILKAGYRYQLENQTLPVVFTGQVSSFEVDNLGQDVAVTLSCSDGYTPSTAIRISKSIDATPLNPITADEVFNELILEWGKNGIASSDESIQLVNDEIPNSISAEPVINPFEVTVGLGWNYEGYLRDAMDDICKAHNLTWYINNSILYIQPKDYPKQRSLIELNENLIKSARTVHNKPERNSTTESQEIKIKTFLDGRITIGKYLKVLSGRFKGTYSVSSVKHIMDLRQGEWSTVVECEVLS